MSKISREDNKKRFKTGMYPTQQDFENVFDSYLHKDDDVPMEKVKSNGETVIELINRKAEERHNHPISEVDNLSETLQQIQDDLDTAEDNIAGHETRIVTLEAAKTDYEAFKERVRAFLEDANASDTTIDRWHEIENFLQGITDTETLTGLLNDLKQEILGSIPEPQTGNYLELVDDLDAYTDAPDGKIVKYVGQTNEKYTRGFDYERVAGGSIELPENSEIIRCDSSLRNYGDIGDGDVSSISGPFWYTTETVLFYGDSRDTCGTFDIPRIGDYIYLVKAGKKELIRTVTEDNGSYVVNNDYQISANQNFALYKNAAGYYMIPSFGETTVGGTILDPNKNIVGGFICEGGYEMLQNSIIINTPSTWQPIPSFNVIN